MSSSTTRTSVVQLTLASELPQTIHPHLIRRIEARKWLSLTLSKNISLESKIQIKRISSKCQDPSGMDNNTSIHFHMSKLNLLSCDYTIITC